ncbi:MAG: type II toxin-antitoxin system RelB/DinJ family antitoxin [Clostridiales bacterium]|nr:type II toxin-antitoxin system RelB/DinJ family antitoxin [Clostridiales bacterium]
MLSTARISVNVDEEVKKGAQKVLGEIGMDLTTAIDLLLRAIVREERIPFDLRTEKSYREEVYRQCLRAEIEKSKAEASDPKTKWLSHGDVTVKLDEQRMSRHGAQT